MKTYHIISLVLVLLLFAATSFAQNPYRIAPYPTTPVGPYQASIPTQTLVPADHNIHIYPSSNHQSEFSVAAHPTDHNKLLVGANTMIGGTFYQGYYYTTNGGLNWSGGDILPGVSAPAADPAVAFDAGGNVFFNYLQSLNGGYSYRLFAKKSTNTGANWGNAVEVPTSQDVDKDHFVADLTSSSPYANYLYSAYSDFSTFPGTPIKLSRSINGGTSFLTAANISGSNTGYLSQGVNLAVNSSGHVYAIWSIYDDDPFLGEDAIGFNKTTNGGVSWIGSTRILNVQGIRNQYGWTNHNPTGVGVRVNGFPSMAVDRSGGAYNGYIYIVWADKRYDHSDILLSRSINGGTTWSTPIRVNTDAQGNGKDQWMPWIAVNPDGVINVTFFDSRNDPDNMYVESWGAYSTDGGASFKDFRVNDAAKKFYWYPIIGSYAGDYNGIAATKQYSFPVWADPRDNGTTLQAYTERFGTYKNVATVYGTWQMVSLPNFMHDTTKAFVYPTRTSLNVTTYDVCSGLYTSEDPLWAGGGFWAKFGIQQNITYIGEPIYNFAIPVQTCGSPAWNMIGSISKTVSTSSIIQNPPGIVISDYFKTNSSGQYVTTATIEPGMGIWVKVSQAGTLTLQASAPKVSSFENQYASLDKFTITDQNGHMQDMFVRNGTLSLNKGGDENVEMPPPPPDEFFSARFSTNNYVQTVNPESELTELPIVVKSAAYPLTLAWELKEQNAVRYSLVHDGKEITLRGSNKLTINNPTEQALLLKATAGAVLLPQSYALNQNYPNPFNPQTRIDYSLPETKHVKLVIYDVLGREVVKLVDEVQVAGYKSVSFSAKGGSASGGDAGNLPSGVYLYRITTGKFTDVKKMILLR